MVTQAPRNSYKPHAHMNSTITHGLNTADFVELYNPERHFGTPKLQIVEAADPLSSRNTKASRSNYGCSTGYSTVLQTLIDVRLDPGQGGRQDVERRYPVW